MNEPKSDLPVKIKHPIPVPYPVLALAWLVALLATNRFFHDISFYVWLAGPAVILLKVYYDAEIIGLTKDNPPPRQYDFHAPGVWAQLDQTIKTLPGYFTNVSVYVNYQNLNPPKGMPMQLDATITVRHPDVDKGTVPAAKQNDMKSTITLKTTIMPMGNTCLLTMKFKTDPLIGRKPLDPIIDHICDYVDQLVKQHIK
jgi:hypothetical protein